MEKLIERILCIAEALDDFDKEEFEKICEELEDLDERTIRNIDNFKRELERQGLMTEKLNEFIENHVRFDNES